MLFRSLGKPDRDFAIRLLNGTEYLQTKAQTMLLLEDFFHHMEERTNGEIEATYRDRTRFGRNLL